MKSHTGAIMTLGGGAIISSSTRQKINTKSSTKAELVGVDDAMLLITWTREFIEGQGIPVTDRIVYHDNQSAILLEKNGRASSGKRTQHIKIRYFLSRIASSRVSSVLNTGLPRICYLIFTRNPSTDS